MATLLRTREATRDAAPESGRSWTRIAAYTYAVATGIAILAWLLFGDAWWTQPVNVTTFWWSVPAIPAMVVAAAFRQPRVVAALALPAVLFAWAYGGLWTGTPQAAEGDVRIATYNTFVRAENVDHVVDLVRDESPDVLLVQEVFPEPAEVLRSRLADDMPHVWFGDPGDVGGVGVLSRYPITAVQPIEKVGRYTRPTSVVRIEVPVSGASHPLQVVPVHLTSPCPSCGPSVVGRQAFEARIRAEEMDAIVAALDPDVPAVVGGDFNSTRRSDPYRRLTGAGFRDPQIEAGSGPGFTWPGGGTTSPSVDSVPLWRRVPIVRIDWVLARGLIPASAHVSAPRASDHRPVVTDLAWPDGDRTTAAPWNPGG